MATEPCLLVIFGASGDLTRKKLLPALYNLAEDGLLPEQFATIGVALPAMNDATYRAEMQTSVAEVEGETFSTDVWKRIEDRLTYMNGDFDDDQLYTALARKIEEVARGHQTGGNVLFYLAVPPSLFAKVAHHLDASGLTREQGGWRRVVIEKPFGYDLESARALNQELSKGLKESQIYRIDHYLGKETVQNILAFRFANGIFEPIWNRRYIDHVQMTVAEDNGIGSRGAYYDHAGALRDIVQNHMFQVLTLVAMEPPTSFEAETVRDEKVKVLRAIQRLTPDDVRRHVVRGQYRGYRQEKDVAPQSTTETYVALRLFLESWRWAGVPFYLRTGKRLPQRMTEVAIQFKCAPLTLFRETPIERLDANVLTLRIQPNEGIELAFEAKVPGPFERLGTVKMDFSYADYFGAEAATGYETLLYDAMLGDQTLFHRMDIVEAGWEAVMPILDGWANGRAPDVREYEAGSWGPTEADVLMERDGHAWRA